MWGHIFLAIMKNYVMPSYSFVLIMISCDDIIRAFRNDEITYANVYIFLFILFSSFSWNKFPSSQRLYKTFSIFFSDTLLEKMVTDIIFYNTRVYLAHLFDVTILLNFHLSRIILARPFREPSE